jgi:predicted SnoaL-like aldol condensation-catalyzing enzyme
MPVTAIRNKEIVERFYDAVRVGDVDRFDDLMVEDYQQHHPLIDNGRAAVKAFFRPVGPIETDVHRVIAEGDLVTAHVHYKSLNLAAVDIFRINDDGQIVEHWDVSMEVPESTASGNDLFRQYS